MNQSDDPPLTNPSRRYIRVFLVLAALFLAMPAAAVLAVAVQRPTPQQLTSGGGTALILLILVGLPLSISMLLSALITLPAAGQTDRSIADFRDGRCLVRWDYTPEEWRAYVDGETVRTRKVNWWIVGLVWGATLIAGIGNGWTDGKPLSAKIAASLAFPLVVLIFGVVGIGLVRIIGNRRRRRLLASPPRTYISGNAFYCGGDFNYWGSGMRGLQDVRLLPGPPPVIEFVVGLSRGGKNASKAVGVAALAAGHVLPTASFYVRQRVPVPPGAEAEAEKLLRTLAAAVQ